MVAFFFNTAGLRVADVLAFAAGFFFVGAVVFAAGFFLADVVVFATGFFLAEVVVFAAGFFVAEVVVFAAGFLVVVAFALAAGCLAVAAFAFAAGLRVVDAFAFGCVRALVLVFGARDCEFLDKLAFALGAGRDGLVDLGFVLVDDLVLLVDLLAARAPDLDFDLPFPFALPCVSSTPIQK